MTITEQQFEQWAQVQADQHAEAMAEIAAFGATLAAQAEESRLLREQLEAFMAGPPVDDGTADFDGLALGDFVRLGDQWPVVLRKATEHTLEGEARQVLYLRDDIDVPMYRYEVTEGERFVVSGPF